MIDPPTQIHATADVEPDVGIGAGTTVWHRAQIRSGARIGRNGVIGRDVFIDEGVTVGDMVKVQNGALIYHGVTVGDGVFIGPGAILTNDRRPRALNARGGLARAADWVVSPITIGGGASIGAGAVVVAGCDVGPFAMIGAGSVVTHDVPAYAIVVGNPARSIGWACVCGERLADPTGRPASPAPPTVGRDLVCPACDRRYEYEPDATRLRESAPAADDPGIPA